MLQPPPTQDGSTLTAGYTGDNLRAWKQNTNGRTYFLYDGDHPIIELSSGVTTVNTFGPTGLLSRHTAAGSVFYSFGSQGSVAHRTDSSWNVISNSLFDAYGNKLSAGSQSDPWGYVAQAGYFTDAETGLILCTHRYYDPALGRWLNRDPIGYVGGVNLYGYVGNGPVRSMDPAGFDTSADIPNQQAVALDTIDNGGIFDPNTVGKYYPPGYSPPNYPIPDDPNPGFEEWFDCLGEKMGRDLVVLKGGVTLTKMFTTMQAGGAGGGSTLVLRFPTGKSLKAVTEEICPINQSAKGTLLVDFILSLLAAEGECAFKVQF